MLEKIEAFIRDLLATLQTVKLYATGHPIFKKSVDKTYMSLQEALGGREEIAIGIIGEELAFEKEIFFDLSRMVRPVILYLKSRGIERMVFYLGTEKEELVKFIEFLAAPKEEIKGDPQQILSLMGVKNITAGRVKAPTQGVLEKVKEPLTPLSVYESSSEKVSESLNSVLNLEAMDHLTLRFSLNNVMENLSTQYQELLKLATVKRHDLETFTHLLNVSILAMHFSSKLGLSKDAVLDIGVAALFHDIGKLYISRKVVTKAEALTEEEFAQIKSHTVLGAELLLKYVDTLGILPVVVAFEHHLKYDLSGYPKLAFAQKPNISSMIVSICDVYDALSERRGYKSDYPPDMIYNLMIKERGAGFEPDLVDKFFRIMGVWPIGSVVSLNDERVAVVIDENEDDISSPKVEVIHPIEKKEVIDLSLEKDRLRVAKFLNPWKEGRDYLHLIGAPQPKKAQ